MSVGDCFRSLIGRIQPSTAETDAKQRHGSEIQSSLKSTLRLHSTKNLGSHVRGTAICKFSDLDLFAVFHREDATRAGSFITSNTALKWIKEALIQRYPQTESSRDGQAIVVHFSDGDVDVVPAVFKEMMTWNGISRPCYWIPNGDNGWMESAPELHAEFISKAHVSSGKKFNYCVQLLKYWRECRSPRTPIGSFHLELLFANAQTFSGVISYQECIRNAFQLLYTRRCCAIRDPLAISGLVNAAHTEAQIQTAFGHVGTALDKANRALEEERNGSQSNARYYWNLVFNDGFPAL